MDWFRMYGDMPNDPKIGTLNDAEFRREFYKALRGEASVMSDYVHAGYDRLSTLQWSGLRKQVFVRDGEVCAYCGTTSGPFEIDHVIPLAIGGTNELDNLAVACRPCNRQKNSKTPKQWRLRND